MSKYVHDPSITKLDLGDTYHGEGCDCEPGWTCITLDDVVDKGKIIADYTHSPFPDNTFEYIYGACFLEFEENIDYLGDGIDAASPDFEALVFEQFKELYRILAPGGHAEVSECEFFPLITEDTESVERIEYVNKNLQVFARLAQQAGFIIDPTKWCVVADEMFGEDGQGVTMLTLKKLNF